MPHGDLSDFGGVSCLAFGLASIFKPSLWYEKLGPVEPMFTSKATPDALVAIRFVGAVLMFCAVVLYVNRWNRVNGAAGAIGCLTIAGNAIHIALAMDKYTFVLRGWYVFAAAMVITALHLLINPNPTWTSALLAEEEKKKAAKKAGKAN